MPAMTEGWKIPVIYYHHVSDDIDSYTAVSSKVFESQMKWICSEYEIISVSKALELYRHGVNPVGKVVLTFDDGYEDNYINALPILNEQKAQATFFILPSYLNKHNHWNTNSAHAVSHLSQAQVFEIHRQGHEIGSHGISHTLMNTLQIQVCRSELKKSYELIQKLLNTAPSCFAYPYGVYNELVMQEAGKLYDVAFSTIKSEKKDWNENRYNIRRIYLEKGLDKKGVLQKIKSY